MKEEVKGEESDSDTESEEDEVVKYVL